MDPRIRLLLRMVQEHKGIISFTSKEASRLLGLGEASLLRLFNREVGIPFRCHLRAVRMASAAEYVKSSLMPIKTISIGCGYTDLGNFYRDFKQIHGMTPIKMRLSQLQARSETENVNVALQA